MSTPLTAQTDPWSSYSDFPPSFVGKMTKNGHKREQSYEGHLGFKSTVSPLFSALEEEERKKKTLIVVWNPILLQGKKMVKSKKKADAKVIEPP